MRRVCLLLLFSSLASPVAGAAATTAPPARAATPSPPTTAPAPSGGTAAAGSPAQRAAFERALERVAAKDFAGAVALLEPFAKSGEALPPVRTVLAASYIELGRAADAAAAVAPIAERDDAPPLLLYQASRAAAALGQGAQAEGYLARAAAKEPASIAARTLGLHRAAAGELVEACRLLRPYVAVRPADEEARLAAAYCSLQTGDLAAGEELLRPLPAELPRARVLRARLALLRGQPYDAIAQLEPLAASPPPEIAYELRRNLSEAWLEVGKAPAAVELLAGHVGDDLQLGLLLLRAREQAGDPDGVIAAAAPFSTRLLAAEAPKDVPRQTLAKMALSWGRALLNRQRWAEAVTALQAATRWAPDDAPAWQGLVQALRGAGRREEAEAAMSRLREVAAAASATKP